MNTTAAHPFAALTPNPPALPTIRDEDWRFTPLKAVTGQAWAAPSAAPVKFDAPDLGGPRLVFLNGRLDDSLSRPAGLPAGVTISRELPPLRQAAPERPFVALNAAGARDGAVIRVARNVKVENPLQVVYAGGDGAAFARLRLELAQGAELAVAEHFTGAGRHFLGSVTEASVGANASLKIARVVADSAQAVHIAEFCARLARDARLVLDSIALEAELARTELRIELDGE
ncbi:MAG: SufD family Fe-S cluster assembly protein, partial [Planctomycetes bacterium]|nr:SufD family Fe-S cluster assembly protein [Planctomycetota bacterium]